MLCYRFVIGFIVIFSLLRASLCRATPLEIRIGVLADQGKDATMEMWSGTAAYLSSKIPQHVFKIVPLDFNQIEPATGRGNIDFVIANPEIYINLEKKYGVSRIATLLRNTQSGPVKVYGGVIFCRADRDAIKTLLDIKGKKLMAVNETSLGGWAVALNEFITEGIDPKHDFSKLSFGGIHDTVVYAVRNREVDVGTVRTGTLERMESEGKIDLAEFRVLNRKAAEYPFLLSTGLYPEWPFAKIKRTHDELARDVVVALLNMQADDPAALSAKVEGWTIPLPYQPVEELMKKLRIGVYEDYGKISLSSAIGQYRLSLTSLLMLFLFLAATTAYMIRLNHKLHQSQAALEKSRDDLDAKVKERTSSLETEIEKSKMIEEQLRISLQEKEILLKEVHHRVKNNLQVISSMLHLQSSRVTDREVLMAFRESQSRVDTMALIHAKLYHSRNLTAIKINDYVTELVANLYMSFGINNEIINESINVADIYISVNTAIPCGLIINELVTNSIKHAFPGGRSGKIIVSIQLLSSKMYLLSVSDNGIGFPDSIDFRNTETLGLKLVTSLVSQMDGTIELDRAGGTTFSIRFPEM